MEPADKIISCAGDYFLKTSIRSVTMDDLAGYLSISKKTIYRYFKNKNELVTEFVKQHIKKFEEQINLILLQSDNVLSQIKMMLVYSQEIFSRITPSVINEIKTCYPEAWNIFREFKSVFLVGALEQLLKKGKVQGCIRQNLDEHIIAQAEINLVETCLNNVLFPAAAFDSQVVRHQLLEHFCISISMLK